jgi:hypothetical protein
MLTSPRDADFLSKSTHLMVIIPAAAFLFTIQIDWSHSGRDCDASPDRV